MTDAQLEKAARWLCEQRGWDPDRIKYTRSPESCASPWTTVTTLDDAKERVTGFVQMQQAAAIALSTVSGTEVKVQVPIHPAPDDVMRVRSENARRFDRILEDVEANKVPTWALQAAARAWCEDSTRMIEMDSRLAIEFARILVNSKSAERESCARVADRFDRAAAAGIRRME